ncbi:unnamed protein product [Phytomonas sp. Hart1]|nr:unnamed protein product [Phytomonas sp. Hart1]|eukprot:CCW69078.1 unnamed protein product [Phytomonas sp. isolate Hart1]
MSFQTIDHDEPLPSSLQLSFPLNDPVSILSLSTCAAQKKYKNCTRSSAFDDFESKKNCKVVSSIKHFLPEPQVQRTKKHAHLPERHPLSPFEIVWPDHRTVNGSAGKESGTATSSKGITQANVQKQSTERQVASKPDLVYNKNDYLFTSNEKEADVVDIDSKLSCSKHIPTFKGHASKGNFYQDGNKIHTKNEGCCRGDCYQHKFSHRMTKKNDVQCADQPQSFPTKSSVRRALLASPENETITAREENNELLSSLNDNEAKQTHPVGIPNSVLSDLVQSLHEMDFLGGKVKNTSVNTNNCLSREHICTSPFLQSEAGASVILPSRGINDRRPESPQDFASVASLSFIDIKCDPGVRRPNASLPFEHQRCPKNAEGRPKEDSLKKAALRSRFITLCSCYWSHFPELGMPINPASHAPKCPCYDKQSEYESAVMSSEEAYENSLTAGLTRSLSSSLNEKSDLGRSHEKKPHECCTEGDKHKAIIASTGGCRTEREVGTKTKEIQMRKQITASAAGSISRSVIFGAAKRSTLFDEIIRERSMSCGSNNSARHSFSSTPLHSSCRSSRVSSRALQKEDQSPRRSRSTNEITMTPPFSALETGKTNPPMYLTVVDNESSATVAQGKENTTNTHQNSPNLSKPFHESSRTWTVDTLTGKKKETAMDSVEQNHLRSHSSRTPQHRRLKSPGPGAYDILSAYARSSANLKPRQGSFGKAPRRTLETVRTKTETPGPGTYDILSSSVIPLVHEFSNCEEGKATLEAKQRSASPFIPKSSQSIRYKSHTCIPQVGTSGRDVTPGPGQYSPERAERNEARHTTSPAYSFGKLSHFASPSPSEAPASGRRTQGFATTPNTTLTAPQGPKKGGVPGPADYDVRTGNEIGASGRSAILGTKTSRGTSPSHVNSALVGSMVRTNREGEAPGPGSYALDGADRWVRPKTPSYSFSGLSRGTSPLPWDIMTSSIAEQDLCSSRWTCASLPFPGPNHYDTIGGYFMSSQYRNSPQWTIRSQRFNDAHQRLLNNPKTPSGDSSLVHVITRGTKFPYSACDPVTPGPGEYVPLYTIQQRSSKQYSFGAAPRFVRPTPPPCNASGDADPDQRSEGRFGTGVPGPGNYALNTTVKHTGGFIAKTPRPNIFGQVAERSMNLPGPGTYELDSVVTMANRPSAVIGSTARQGVFTLDTDHTSHRGECLPGPGSYELPELSLVGPVCPFSNSERFLSATKCDGSRADYFNFPGPDAYHVPLPSSQATTFIGPSLSRAQRFNQDLLDEKYKGSIPGAGTYDVMYGKFSDLKDAGASNRGVVFGTATQRDEIGNGGDSGCAGPGTYDPSVFPTIPTYPRTTFSQTSRDLVNQEHYVNTSGTDSKVGPGTYSPIFVDVNTHQRSAVIGTAPRETNEQAYKNGEVPQATTPGPGSYEVCMTRDGDHILYYPSEADTLRHIRGPVTFGTAPSSRNALEGASDGNYTNSGPGPGAYSPTGNSAFGSDRPGGLIGSQKRFAEDCNIYTEDGRILMGREPLKGPGPCYYQPSYAQVETRTPAFGFGAVSAHDKSSIGRSVFNGPDDIPGPGEYDIGAGMQHSGQPVHSFSTSIRLPEDGERGTHSNGSLAHNEAVGPGSYDVSSDALRLTMRTAPVYSFSSASRVQDAVCTSELVTGGEKGIYKSSMVSTEVEPGPGDYQTTDNIYLTHQSLPVYTFGTANRFHSSPEMDGDSLDPTHGDGRKRDGSLGQSLGPGSYSIPPAFPCGPQHRFGTAPTHRGITLGLPSADNAFQNDTHKGGVTMDRLSGSPGPGSYDVPTQSRGPAITIGSNDARKLWVDHREQVSIPGPGAYDVAASIQASSAPTLGKALRFNAEANVHKKGENEEVGGTSMYQTPGPGAYSPKESSIGGIGTGPSSAFSKAEREITTEIHQPPGSVLTSEPPPGPGHYILQDYFPLESATKGGVAMRYTAARLGSEKETKGTDSTPGPGYYDASEERKGTISIEEAGPSFPLSERFPRELQKGNTKNEVQDGPGWYDIPLKDQAPACSFSKATRFQEVKNHGPGIEIGGHSGAVSGPNFPGPGSYDVEEASKAISKREPAFSMIPRRGEDAAPGSWDTNLTEKKTSLPGPGHYDVLNYRAIGDPRSRSTALYGRYESSIVETPGPGFYDVKQKIIGKDASAFSITGRAAARGLELRSGSPGPGSYDEGSALAHLHGRGPAFSIAGCSDFQNTHAGGMADIPGPGHYVLPSPPSGPEVRFGVSARTTATGAVSGSHASNPNDNGVGPGMYNVHTLSASPSYSFYHSDRSLSNDGKMKEKEADGGVESSPGPGSYHSLHVESQLLNPGLSISFPKAPRMDSTENREAAATPGPGEYYRPPILVQGNSDTLAYSTIGKSQTYLKNVAFSPGSATQSSGVNYGNMGEINNKPFFDADSKLPLKRDVNTEFEPQSTEGLQGGNTVEDIAIQNFKKTGGEPNPNAGSETANGVRSVRHVHFADEKGDQKSENPIPSSNFNNPFTTTAVQNSVDLREIYLEKLAKAGYPVKRRQQ